MSRRPEISWEQIAEFCKRRHIRKLALIGSVLRDYFNPESDIDVLVKFEVGHVLGLAFFNMEAELAAVLGLKEEPHIGGALSSIKRSSTAVAGRRTTDWPGKSFSVHWGEI